MTKKIISVLTLCIVITSLFLPSASAFLNANQEYNFKNRDNTDKAMNILTWGSGTSGDNVTLYTYSGSATQTFVNRTVTTGGYRLESKSNSALSLNYNQATTKCTVYPAHALDTSRADYAVEYAGVYIPMMSVLTISLMDRDRNLGTSGSFNGAQLYWYLGNPTSEEHWLDI